MSQCESESIQSYISTKSLSIDENQETRCSICLETYNTSLLKTYQQYLDDKLQNQKQYQQLNNSSYQFMEKNCECKLVYCETCLDEWAKILKYSKCPTCKKVTIRPQASEVYSPTLRSPRPAVTHLSKLRSLRAPWTNSGIHLGRLPTRSTWDEGPRP